jgi:fatty acid desaturase
VWLTMFHRAHLLLFPSAEIVLLGAALAAAASWPIVAAILLAPAALTMSLTLHISVHEHAHQEFGRAFDLLATVLVGVPFSGYVAHHWNHHEHVNSLEDFSTTFVSTARGVLPRHPIAYAARWPLALIAAENRRRSSSHQGVPKSRMRQEQLLLLLLWIGLALHSPATLGAYLGAVYLGWFFISLHNYAQHPPVAHGAGVTTSYTARWYNAVFCNNGLHAEHHADSRLPWEQLVVDASSTGDGRGREPTRQVATAPHLLGALFPPTVTTAPERPA